MKRIIPILSTLLALLICSACTNADEPIKIKDPETVVPPDDPKEDSNESYNPLLIGEWHFYSGEITAIIGNKPNIYNQILTFNSAGNYTENDIWSNGEVKHVGNWSAKSNTITVNDWEGNKTSYPIYIKNISQDKLQLSINGQEAIYLKDNIKFNNLGKDILGDWYEFTDEKNIPFYTYNNDGIASHVYWKYMFGSSILFIGKYEWVLTRNHLSLYNENMPHSPSYMAYNYTIKYCNSKYMGLETGNNTKHLYRK